MKVAYTDFLKAIEVIETFSQQNGRKNPWVHNVVGELIAAEQLGLRFNPKQGKGQPDAFLLTTGDGVELKVKNSLTLKELQAIFKTGVVHNVEARYSGAYNQDNIENYANELNLVVYRYRGIVVLAIKVPSNEIREQLLENIQERACKEAKTGKRQQNTYNYVKLGDVELNSPLVYYRINDSELKQLVNDH